jgi:hypothetical protein
MHKSATKCNETVGKWCKNKHGASKIIDTLEMYHSSPPGLRALPVVTRVNSTNVQYEGLRIGGVGCRMNSKVKSVKQGVYQK